jgi:hypothetical protein
VAGDGNTVNTLIRKTQGLAIYMKREGAARILAQRQRGANEDIVAVTA